MSSVRRGKILLLSVILCLYLTPPSSNLFAEKILSKVQEILEGDIFTIKVENSDRIEKVRIYGIDTPDEGQNFYKESKQYLTDILLNKDIQLDILAQDNQGYKVAKVTLSEKGDSISEIMIKEGYAWWDEENAKDAIELKKLCAEAIRQKKGLWNDPAPLAPWDYRKSKGLPDVRYAVTTTATEEKSTDEKKEEPKVLKAKGDEVYKGTFSSSGAPYIDVSKIQFDTKNIDPNQLLMNHMPTVAKDPAGNPIGLAVPNISQIPYATMLGFQDGDIITSVNGVPIRDFSQVMPLYEQFKGVKELSVQILRNGQPTTLYFRLP
ncbi:MAG: thermonuclease family protein [Candidatus Hydrogenedentes bacterium]|nr:thermonuclease family protein [Candidatus Hydrogenedentota bacterium]